MPSNFDIDGVKFTLKSYIPDEVIGAFYLISEQRYQAGFEDGQAAASKPPKRAKRERTEQA